MLSAPPKFNHIERASQGFVSPRKGFALVIALGLMAFVLLLMLSLTTFVRVESTQMATQLNHLQARQNALLASMVALGNLQKSMGPDARVSAPASIYDTEPESEVVQGVANPYWLGVFMSRPASGVSPHPEVWRQSATSLGASSLVQWLVSSQQPVTDPRLDASLFNADSPDNLVLMERHSQVGAPDAEVFAGRIPIKQGSASSTPSGAFAWWVADESMKAKVNLIAEETTSATARRSFFTSPQRSDVRLLDGFSDFDPESPILQNALRLSRTVDNFRASGIALAESFYNQRQHFTFHSQSIPVDVTEGRLQQDLSVYLQTGLGLSGSQVVIRGSPGDSDYTGFSWFSDLQGVDNLPRFSLIRSWYQMGQSVTGFSGGTAPAPRLHTSEQHGLKPEVIRYGLFIRPVYIDRGDNPDGAGRLVEPAILLYPRLVLWNPTSVPIATSDYVIRMRFPYTITYNNLVATNGSFNPSTGIQDNLISRQAQDSEFNNLEYLAFSLPEQNLYPGETALITVRPSNDFPFDIVSEQLLSLASASVVGEQTLNLLEQGNNSEFGFFIVPSGTTSVFTPGGPDSTDSPANFRANVVLQPPAAAELRQFNLMLELYNRGAAIPLVPLHSDDFRNTRQQNAWPQYNISNFELIDISDSDTVINKGRVLGGHQLSSTRLRLLSNYPVSDQYRLAATRNVRADNLSDGPQNPTPRNRLFKTRHSTFLVDDWFDGVGWPSRPHTLGPQSGRTGSSHIFSEHGAVPGGLRWGTNYIFFDFPRENSDLLSLGRLQHVNFGRFRWQPSMPFGNSKADPFIPREKFIHDADTNVPNELIDLSYLLNASMWDRFFVSGIPQQGALEQNADGTTRLPNNRMRLNNNDVPQNEWRGSATAFSRAARHVTIDGGFNVNSTSVEAWITLLNSFLGVPIDTITGANSHNPQRVAFARSLYPLVDEMLAVGDSSNLISVNSKQSWGSVRSLSRDEIQALANAIVAEIKRRGPFLSIADFVNRRLQPSSSDVFESYQGLMGPIQAAITEVSNVSDQGWLNARFLREDSSFTAIDEGTDRWAVDPDHARGAPAGRLGSTMEGVPGYLSQADILSAIGSVLTVRGDTFVIRSYGEVNNPITGRIIAKSRGELMVQRVVEPVDLNDDVIAPEGGFGRKFEIIGFRWMDGGSK